MALRSNAAIALMKLLTNNKVPPARDTEDHQLKSLFRLAYDMGHPDAPSLLQYATTLDLHHRKEYTRLVHKGYDFLTFVISTRASKHYDHFMTDSRRIVEVQHWIWGLLKPLFMLMWQQMLYISSTAPLPERQEDQDQATYAADVCSAASRGHEGHHLSRPLLDMLVEASDEAFNEHLGTMVHLIGTRDATYAQAFLGYSAQVSDRIQELVDAFRLDQPSKWGEQDELAYDETLAKIHLLVVEQMAYQPTNSPAIDGNVPLLSSVAASMILEEWWALRDVLYTVSPVPCPSQTKSNRTFIDQQPVRSSSWLHSEPQSQPDHLRPATQLLPVCHTPVPPTLA